MAQPAGPHELIEPLLQNGEIIKIAGAAAIGTLIYVMQQYIIRKGLEQAEANWKENTDLPTRETPESLQLKSQLIALSTAVVCAGSFYYYVPAILIMGAVVVLTAVYFTFFTAVKTVP
jgi:hypothetical protein